MTEKFSMNNSSVQDQSKQVRTHFSQKEMATWEVFEELSPEEQKEFQSPTIQWSFLDEKE